jgi:hypothetical protein
MKPVVLVREAGLEPARPKTQVPKTCVSAISPLPQKSAYLGVADTELLFKFCGYCPRLRVSSAMFQSEFHPEFHTEFHTDSSAARETTGEVHVSYPKPSR